ncbi:hypothetical protein [Ulvibacterium marinum]|nr:hypothetical protein [Ulvibacterium marinum]
MENIMNIPNIYRRLYNLQEKSKHYYSCLRIFLGRIEQGNQIHVFLNEKISRREQFAKELSIVVNKVRSYPCDISIVQRPVAVYWLSKEELLNVNCFETAKKLLYEADLKSINEYRYLLNVKGLPEEVSELANVHSRILEQELLRNRPAEFDIFPQK